MDERIERAITAIEAQQKGEAKRSAVWFAGEQLKDICIDEPESAELVATDLIEGGMTLKEAEKRIKKFADQHKTGQFACVSPREAETILRDYFGLPKRGETKKPGTMPVASGPSAEVRLEDFF